MKYAKSNEMKGVILAVVAIFAMIAAGCVIAATDGGVDAKDIDRAVLIDDDYLSNLGPGEGIDVVKNARITIDVTSTTNITLTVAKGVTATVQGVSSNNAPVVLRDAADNTVSCTTAIGDGDSIVFIGGSDTVSAYVSGKTDKALAVVNNVAVDADPKKSLEVASPVANLGWTMMYDYGGTITYYGTTPSKFDMKPAEAGKVNELTVKEGDITVNARNDASILLFGEGDDVFSSTDGLKISYTTDGSVNTVEVSGEIDMGGLKVLAGKFIYTEDYMNLVGINYFEATTKYLSATFPEKYKSEVLGEFELTSNATVIKAVEINEENKLIVPKGKTLTIGKSNLADRPEVGDSIITISDDAKLDVFGKLLGVTSVWTDPTDKTIKESVEPKIEGAGEFIIRNGADVKGITVDGDNAWITELPAVDNPFRAGAPIEKDLDLPNVLIGRDGDSTLTIPEGLTLTIREMIALGEDTTLNINGTLVLADGAQLGSCMHGGQGSTLINLGANGKIVNNGTIAKYVPIGIMVGDIANFQFVGLRAVEGLVIDTADYDDGSDTITMAAISGNITPIDTFKLTISGSEYESFIVANALVNADMTIAEKVSVGGALIIEDTTLTLNGEVANDYDVNVSLVPKSGTSVFVNNGKFCGEVSGGTNVSTKKYIESDDGSNGFAVSGYTVYATAPAKEKDPVKVYVYGDLVYSPTLGKSDTPDATLTFSDRIYIAAGDTLTQSMETGKEIAPVIDGVVIVEGTYVSKAGDWDSTVKDQNKIIGTWYEVEVDKSTSNFIYEGIIDGIRNIANAVDTTVVVYAEDSETGTKLDDDLVLKDKEKVESNGIPALVISRGVSLTVSNGAILDEAVIKNIDGKLIVEKDGDCTPDKSKYGLKNILDDGTTIYMGLQTAIDEAKPGDTLVIDTDDNYLEELIVKSDITLLIDDGGELKVGKTITVEERGTFSVIDGKLTLGKNKKGDAVKGAAITVEGVMEIYSIYADVVFVPHKYIDPEGKEEITPCTVTSTGEFRYSAGSLGDEVMLIGANIDKGEYMVLTTLKKALEDPDVDEITISGNYEDTGKFVLDKKKLIITGDVTLGELDITDGEVEVTGTLTTKMTGKSGTSTSAAVEVEAFTGNASDLADSKGEYTMVISDITGGDVTVASGTVDLNQSPSVIEIIIPKGTTFTVASGATMNIPSFVVIKNQGTFKLLGTLNVPEGSDLDIKDDGKVYLDGTTNVIGNMSVGAASIFSAKGTINADGTFEAVSLELTGTLNANGLVYVKDTLTVGEYKPTTGADAAVNGKNLNVAGHIVVYAGSTISADIAKTYGSTEFYLNSALYLTAYTNRTDVLAIGDIIVDPVVIPGYDMSGMVYEYNWVDVSGKTIAVDTVVGDYPAIYFEGPEQFATIKVSFDDKLSVYVDDVRRNNGEEIFDVPAGKHTYRVAVSPNYAIKEGTLKVLFNGTEISGGEFTVDPEMTNTTVNLTVTAEVSADTGGNSGSDDDLIIILLIILVVMVVILAIVTVFRMMRS